MADQHDMAAEALMAHGLLVNLGHQRAGRIEIKEVSRLRIFGHRFRHAVGGKNDRLLAMFFRNLVQFLDEDGALGFQSLDDITVMNDLVADIDRRTVLFQRQNDDLDRPVDTGAETARTAKPDRKSRFGDLNVHSASAVGKCLRPHIGEAIEARQQKMSLSTFSDR
ncbi:hypothetical protein D3C80_607560 [compost metagenome]